MRISDKNNFFPLKSFCVQKIVAVVVFCLLILTSFTILLKQVKILIVILLTLNTSQQLNSLFSDFEQVKNLLVIFAGFKKLTSYFCLLWTSYKLLSEKLHDLLDAMWCYWSLCFLMSPCYLQDAMPCSWSCSDLPQVLWIWESIIYSQEIFTLHHFLLFSRLPWEPAVQPQS